MEIIYHQFNPRMHRNHTRATLLSRYSALYRDTQQTPLRPESRLSIFAYRSASELYLTEFIRTASLFHLHPHCSVQEKKNQSQTPILLISTSLTLPNINWFNKNPPLYVAFGSSLATGVGWNHCVIKSNPVLQYKLLIISSSQQNDSLS